MQNARIYVCQIRADNVGEVDCCGELTTCDPWSRLGLVQGDQSNAGHLRSYTEQTISSRNYLLYDNSIKSDN